MVAKGLVWLRNDLRIADNPALHAACAECDQVIAVYIDEQDTALRPIGGAARVWLQESLSALAPRLARSGIALHFRSGKSAELIPEMAQAKGAGAVYWNRRYSRAEREHDAEIKAVLKTAGISTASFNGNLLVEPWDIATKSGTPFAVFTPMWTALREKPIAQPLPGPHAGSSVEAPALLLPEHPRWARTILDSWSIGEEAARVKFETFLEGALSNYAEGRDIPGKSYTSQLSPYLRFGEISPRQIWHATRHLIDRRPEIAKAGEKFLSEVGWREFSYHLLYHREDIANIPMQERFRDVDWRTDTDGLRRWQRGQTGIPIVDAGMRQLWATGWMHNRVRMLVGSLLAKNLLIDWREGERWFWDTLVDADAGNNPASWQWVAGCGADAAPYFRIFNPVTQGEKFDADGDYVRTWVPELADLPSDYIHKPWTAPAGVLAKSGVEIGTTYPEPIVDLAATRTRALEALGAKGSD